MSQAGQTDDKRSAALRTSVTGQNRYNEAEGKNRDMQRPLYEADDRAEEGDEGYETFSSTSVWIHTHQSPHIFGGPWSGS